MASTFREFLPKNSLFLLILVFFLAVAASIFSVSMPILLDYPNHIARFWLLSGGAQQPELTRFYALDWRRSSLVGMDTLALLLGQVFPYTVVGKIIAFFALAGPPAGGLCLSRTIFGGWRWWQLSFLLLTWSSTALLGFMAFQISLALALFFASVDLVLPQTLLVRLLVRVVFGFGILFFHPFGLAFYVLLLFALIIGKEPFALADLTRTTRIVGQAALALPALVIPVACLLVLSRTPPGHYDHGAPLLTWYFAPLEVAIRLATPFLSYRLFVDPLYFLPLIAIVVFSFFTKTMRIHAGLLTAGLFLCVLSVVSPTGIADEPSVAVRFPIMAALVVFAAVLPEPFHRPALKNAAAIAMMGLALLRLADIEHVWRMRQSDFEAFESALAQVPPGATVLPLLSSPKNAHREPVGRYPACCQISWGNLAQHWPALAIPRQHAFVPTLFAIPGEQPVRILPPWNDLPVEPSDIHAIESARSPQRLQAEPWLDGWDKKFDYVLLLGMNHEDEMGPFVPPPGLRLAADEGYARLYQVERQPPRALP